MITIPWWSLIIYFVVGVCLGRWAWLRGFKSGITYSLDQLKPYAYIAYMLQNGHRRITKQDRDA